MAWSALALGWAAVEVLRGRGDVLTKASLLACLVCWMVSVLLYATPVDFQGYLPVLPLAVLLVVRFSLACAAFLRHRWGWGGFLILVVPAALLASQWGWFARTARTNCTPVSPGSQEPLVSRPPPGSLVITTAYNQMGLYHFHRQIEITEVNADKLLASGGTGEERARQNEQVFRALFRTYPEALYMLDLAPFAPDESKMAAGAPEAVLDSRADIQHAFFEAATAENHKVLLLGLGRDDCRRPATGLFKVEPAR